MTFGRLTVIDRGEDRILPCGKHKITWNCVCECGNHKNIVGDAIKSGRTMSCGCLSKDMIGKRGLIHGETDTKLYGVWCAMKRRCYNTNVKEYKWYGGRGITVHEEWKNNYSSFSDWAYKNGYKEGLTLDRIDNNSDYSPNNCKWVTSAAQANNRRSNHKITYNGETHNITEWASIIGINHKTLFNRIYQGWSLEEALRK